MGKLRGAVMRCKKKQGVNASAVGHLLVMTPHPSRLRRATFLRPKTRSLRVACQGRASFNSLFRSRFASLLLPQGALGFAP